MLFGRKKKDEESSPAPEPAVVPVAPPPAAAVPAPAPRPPVPAPLPAPAPAPVATPSIPAPAASPAAPAPAQITVTPDYAAARVVAANHIIVNAGEGKVVLDVAKDLTGGNAKQMPVDSRIVMTAETARRLRSALDQALAKMG